MNEQALTLLRILIHSGKAAETRVDNLLEEVNLSSTKMMALRQLESAQEPVSLGDLATELHFVKSNATQLADNLEYAQLVRRVPHETDRRCKLLELTEEGRARCDVAREAVQPLLALLEELYSPEERTQLETLLERLHNALE